MDGYYGRLEPERVPVSFPESSINAHDMFFQMYNKAIEMTTSGEMFCALHGLEILIEENPDFNACRTALKKITSGYDTIQSIGRALKFI